MKTKVKLSNEKVIKLDSGNVMHAMKSSSNFYDGFGEAYFSFIKFGCIKGWKLHKKMTLNLLVPLGKVKFVTYENESFQEYIISDTNYSRLTIPPKILFGFQGLSENESLILNIANIEHNPDEVIRKDLNEINYNWRVNK